MICREFSLHHFLEITRLGSEEKALGLGVGDVGKVVTVSSVEGSGDVTEVDSDGVDGGCGGVGDDIGSVSDYVGYGDGNSPGREEHCREARTVQSKASATKAI